MQSLYDAFREQCINLQDMPPEQFCTDASHQHKQKEYVAVASVLLASIWISSRTSNDKDEDDPQSDFWEIWAEVLDVIDRHRKLPGWK